MTLKQYLVDFEDPYKELHRISVVSGISMQTLRPISKGASVSRAQTAKAISSATDGKVTTQALLEL